MDKSTIIYFGTPELAATILEKIIDANQYEITAVISQPDQPVGRKQILTASPVSLLANQHQIPVLKPTKLDQSFINEHQDQLSADLYIVAAYGKIIPQTMLDFPTHGAINVHGSLLPKYRGASPIQSAILNGDQVTGVTIMQMDAQMDHGNILTTRQITIDTTETSQSLSIKMANTGADLLLETIPDYLAGQITPQPQDDSQATFCKLISKQDGYFEIDNPPAPAVFDRMIRAYYPWPNVWTRWDGKVVKFYPESKIQMEGKNIVSLEEFKRGYPDWPLN